MVDFLNKKPRETKTGSYVGFLSLAPYGILVSKIAHNIR
jgi:hypothetical protein